MTNSLDRICKIIDDLKDFDYLYEFSDSNSVYEYWLSKLYTLRNEFRAIYSGLTEEEKDTVHIYLKNVVNNMLNNGLLVDVDMEVVNNIKETIQHITELEI